MGLGSLFNKRESLLSIDIGSSAVKLMELDLDHETPVLVNAAVAPLPENVFSNNTIVKSDLVSEKISGLLEANNIADQRVVVAMPGPSVFTKKIKMTKLPPVELASNVLFEAGSFIPHNIDAVKIDYHVLGPVGKNQLDVLVVAVKNEIIDSFTNCLSLAGLQAAIVDVDYFAMQNCFEIGYPDLFGSTVALINIGSRYSSINICKAGASLFTGDIAVGGKVFTDAIVEELGVSPAEAESLKTGENKSSPSAGEIGDIMDRKIEYVASEYNRQLSLFWNASGAEEGIDKILITGGGSLVEGLIAELSEKTGLDCESIDPFKGIECGKDFDSVYLKEIAPLMTVCVGMGARQPGDKIVTNHD